MSTIQISYSPYIRGAYVEIKSSETKKTQVVVDRSNFFGKPKRLIRPLDPSRIKAKKQKKDQCLSKLYTTFSALVEKTRLKDEISVKKLIQAILSLPYLENITVNEKNFSPNMLLIFFIEHYPEHFEALINKIPPQKRARELNKMDCHEHYPLKSAAEKGRVEPIRCLLKNGAYPQPQFAALPLRAALDYNQIEAAKVLASHTNLRKINCQIYSEPVQKGYIEAVKLLISLDVDPDKNFSISSPLSHAVNLDRYAIAELLLPLTDIVHCLLRAFFYALKKEEGQPIATKILRRLVITKRLPLEDVEKYINIEISTWSSDQDVFPNYLIVKKQLLESSDRTLVKRKSLDHLSPQEKLDYLKILKRKFLVLVKAKYKKDKAEAALVDPIRIGWGLSSYDRHNQSVARRAASDFTQVAKEIIESPILRNVETEANGEDRFSFQLLSIYFIQHIPELALILLQRIHSSQGSYEFNRFDMRQMSPLAVAATLGRIEILSFLLENKADPNKANSQGLTPLYFAFEHNQYRAATILIERSDKQSLEPLLLQMVDEANESAIAILLSNRVSPDRYTGFNSPLVLAIAGDHLNISQMLVHRTEDPKSLFSALVMILEEYKEGWEFTSRRKIGVDILQKLSEKGHIPPPAIALNHLQKFLKESAT